MDILLKFNPNLFEISIDFFQIYKKLFQRGWRENAIENFFVRDLEDAYITYKQNLSKLFLMGFDYWRVPLVLNDVFL